MKLNRSIKGSSILSIYFLFYGILYADNLKLDKTKDIKSHIFNDLRADALKISEDLFFNGKLEINKNAVVFGVISAVGNVEAKNGLSIIDGDFDLKNGTLTVSGDTKIEGNFSCKNFNITDDFNINGSVLINTVGDGNTIIGNNVGIGKVYIEAGNGIFIGENSTSGITIGSSNSSKSIKINTNSTDGAVELSGKSLKIDFSDIEKPATSLTSTNYKYLAIDSDGRVSSRDIVNDVSGGLTIDNITVNASTTLNGTIDINKTGAGITTIGGEVIKIGKIGSENISIYGKNVSLGSNGILLLGYVDGIGGGPVQISGDKITLNGSELYLDFNSIVLPEVAETAYLIIDSTGKIQSNSTIISKYFTRASGDTGTYDKLIVNKSLTVDGNVNLNTTGAGTTTIGSEVGGNVNIKSAGNILFKTSANGSIELDSNNLKLTVADIIKPTSGVKLLVINSDGIVSSENLPGSSLEGSTFASISVTSSASINGIVNINTLGSSPINIGTGTYNGIIKIGNSSGGVVAIDAGINGIKIGENTTGPILIGNETTNLNVDLKTKTNGKINLSGKSINFNFVDIVKPTSSTEKRSLHIDEAGNLYSAEENLINSDFSAFKLTVDGEANLNGTININSGTSSESRTTNIKGTSIVIGDSTTNLDIAGNDGKIAVNDTLIIGENKVEIKGGNIIISGQSLALDSDSIVVPTEANDYKYLLIDSSGKISASTSSVVRINKEKRINKLNRDVSVSTIEYVGNIRINSEGSGTIEFGNLTNGGEISILSADNISLETKNGDISIIANSNQSDNGNIIIKGDGILLPSDSNTVGLKINSSGQIITDVSSKRFKKNIKDLDVSRSDFKSLNFKDFDYENGVKDWGLIAEDLIGTPFENAIIFGQDGLPLSINYRMIFMAMVKDYIKSCEEIEILKKDCEDLEKLVKKVCELYGLKKN